jgi:hypothetical protein
LASESEAVVLITVGVDTHVDVHVAVALDQLGRRLGFLTFPTSPAGYGELVAWVGRLGHLERVGVEGPGSFGAGLTRWLRARGVVVLEVPRPNRQLRRHAGKSDWIDAEAAARAVQAGAALGRPKSSDGQVEMLRALRVARRSAIKARTQAANQLHALVITAPDQLRDELRGLALARLVARAARFRPGPCPQTRPPRPSWPCGWLPSATSSCRPRSPSWSGTCTDWSPRQKVAGPQGGWPRYRGGVAAGRRGQSSAVAQGGRLRSAVWGGAAPGLLGQDQPPSAEPGRQP